MPDNSQFKPLQQRYKSFSKLILIVSTIALGAFYFGYSIAYFSTIQFAILMDVYNITWSKTAAQGILTGCIPIGGGIGALSSGILMKKFSRRQFIFVVNCIAFAAGLLIFIQNPYLLLLLRIVQGFCVGLYSAITPVIIKQISPNQISGTLGALNQFFIAFGIFFTFAFQFILSRISNDQTGKSIWYIVFGFPLLTIILQSLILRFIFPFQTPKYLLENNRQNEAKQLLKYIYQQQFVDEVLQQKYMDMGISVNNERKNVQNTTSILTQKNQKGTQQTESFLQNKGKNSKITVVMALHLALLQQFVGINAVVAYGGQVAGQAIPSLKSIFPIFINLQQVITSLIVSYLLSKVGRKTILQIGTFLGAVSTGIIAIGFFIHQSNQSIGNVFILLGFFIFMANFGISLGPVVWLYIPQIVQPNIIAYSTGVNWGGAALVMLLFPIIKQALPNENPAPLFLFFSAWCVGSFLLNAKYTIETKGKTQKQIRGQYQKMKFLF